MGAVVPVKDGTRKLAALIFIKLLWDLLPGYMWFEKKKDFGMIFKKEISGLQNIFLKYGTDARSVDTS